jgi:hypothetical protein
MRLRGYTAMGCSFLGGVIFSVLLFRGRRVSGVSMLGIEWDWYKLWRDLCCIAKPQALLLVG